MDEQNNNNTPPMGNQNIRKTQMCKLWLRTGKCTRNVCVYAHGQDELSPPPQGRRTKPCLNFMNKNYCQAGDNCHFSHDKSQFVNFQANKSNYFNKDNNFNRSYQKPCFKFFNDGNCPYGENCTFSHDPQANKFNRSGPSFGYKSHNNQNNMHSNSNYNKRTKLSDYRRTNFKDNAYSSNIPGYNKAFTKNYKINHNTVAKKWFIDVVWNKQKDILKQSFPTK
eukprot:GAHX01000407.1.p1 GENE.GAHX01000407.1~~GAHX01000407.1.p1  ORF type:complete len:223 (-),score=23.33 GAHX01000407.1:54-722(-)